MSRSYKKPYSAITTCDSAKDDKILAHRGVRRAGKKALRDMFRFEDFEIPMPHRLECSWNNTYLWGRDGGKIYWSRPSENENNPFWTLAEWLKVQRK